MFGGGYDGGAAFAGGGFMPTQQEQQGGGSGGRSGRQNKEQTLRAVTVRQLVAAAASNPKDTELVVDGHDLANVTLLGKVVSVSERGGNLDLRVDDGTGTMEATAYLENPDDPNAVAQKIAELRPGTYVRVYGSVKGYEGRWTINAFAVRVVHDYNEVTYHFLQVVFQHLHLLKGGGTGVGGAGAGAPPAAAAGYGGAAAGGWQQHMQPPPQQQQPGGYGGAPPAAPMGGPGGMDACQAAVMQVLSDPSCGEGGLHVNDISNRLAPRGFSRMQVEQALQFLQNEAHAYTTSDDMHWRPAL
ncbi:replication factor A2 [Raphidocelis subcapitata]|uniref:Replication factor A2 n=1 Tax=Raphidocelis subcapitata TaxID=307507 RepID=A0A2V0NLK7_9CHLO|nr:replication factor A2 [Raphidocelis subcapitata]|eukprot:GBF88306.1 replication factor A2 [Raphidocelis subcapitata]